MTDAIQRATAWAVEVTRQEAEARQAEAVAQELTDAVAEAMESLIPGDAT